MIVTGKPNVGNLKRFQELLDQVMETGILTNDGPMVRRLEEHFMEMAGVHAVAVSNATVGLELLAHAFTKPGRVGAIGMPSFTFVATPHAFYENWDIHFADLANAYNLSNPLFKTDLDAYCVTNLFGQIADLSYYEYYSTLRRVPLALDNAHCAGMKHEGRSVFAYGDASVLSLHATKILHGFEGGVIFTKHAEIADMCRRFRNFGFNPKPDVAHWNYSEGWGTNAKLSEVHAAMALSNLECLDHMIEHNFKVYELYKKALESTDIQLLELPEGSNYSYVTAILPTAKDRNETIDDLFEAGVIAKKYFDPPCHLLDAYIGRSGDLPVCEDVASRIMCLPTGLSVSRLEVELICGTLKKKRQTVA